MIIYTCLSVQTQLLSSLQHNRNVKRNCTMKIIVFLTFVLVLIKPLNSRPFGQEEFDDDDDDDPDVNEFEFHAAPKRTIEEDYADEEFNAAKKVYEELQAEIKKMQDTLNELRSYELTGEEQPKDEQVDDVDSQYLPTQEDSNEEEFEEDQSKHDTVSETEFQDIRQDDFGDDDDDLAEDTMQDTAQGVIDDDEEENQEVEDEGNTKEEIDVLQRFEGDVDETEDYHQREVQDNLNDDSREQQEENTTFEDDDVDDDDRDRY